MKKRILHFFHQKVFHYQLAFGIFFLNLFGNRELAKKRMEAIAQCAPGTLGYSIYNLMISNNDFKMSTAGGKDAAGTAYAIQGVECEVSMIGNNITSVSNGPNLGIYFASMSGGTSELYIANNFWYKLKINNLHRSIKIK